MTLLSSALFAAWDVEATGLDPASDRVVEVGLALLEGREVVFSGALLVDPGCPIPEDVTLIHGIRDVDVAGAPELPDALEALGQVMPRRPDAYVAHAAMPTGRTTTPAPRRVCWPACCRCCPRRWRRWSSWPPSRTARCCSTCAA